ncbi:tyrosine-type recombinase/integrase [Neisseria dentiae]|nr:tyrosine-type recombinase/integrase [Neisseria dentiae]
MYQGRRRWETLKIPPTPANLKYAAKMRAEIIGKIKIGIFDYAEYFPESEQAKTVPTFEQMAALWLQTSNHLADSTLAGYRKMLNNHVLPAIGHIPINAIKYSRLAALLSEMKCGAKTHNNILTVIRQPFELAFIDGLIETNPAERLQAARVQKEPPDPFTIAEAEQILSHLKGEPVFHNYFELAFFTGLRTSELIALEWADVDFNRAVLRVNKAFVSGATKGTKTHSYRDIELNTRAESALKRQRMITGLKNGLIFINPKTGKQFENDKTAWRPWQRAVRLSGVRYRKPYNTRHTFATLNLMAGANPMWVARQLGHTSMKMLLENYSRWIDSADKQREKSKIETLFCAENVPSIDKISITK